MFSGFASMHLCIQKSCEHDTCKRLGAIYNISALGHKDKLIKIKVQRSERQRGLRIELLSSV